MDARITNNTDCENEESIPETINIIQPNKGWEGEEISSESENDEKNIVNRPNDFFENVEPLVSIQDLNLNEYLDREILLNEHLDRETLTLNLDRSLKKFLPLLTSNILKKIIPFLNKNKIKVLNLNGHEIGDQGAILLLKVRTLKSLYLKDNLIGDEGAINLVKHRRLRTLDLSGNWLNKDGIKALSESKLTKLILLSNQVKQICYNGLLKNKNLTLLDLSGCNRIVNDLGYAVKENKNLKTLIINDMPESQFGYPGFKDLVENSSIQSLEIANNNSGSNLGDYSYSNIGNDEAALLYNSKIAESLTSLNLSKNNIGDKGVYKIVAGMPHLKILNLSWNQISDKGAQYLLKSSFSYLSELHLQGNSIGNSGAIYLSDYKYTSIKYLNLSDNKISDIGARRLEQSVQFEVINLKNNDLNHFQPLTSIEKVELICSKKNISGLKLLSFFAICKSLENEDPEYRQQMRDEVLYISNDQLDVNDFLNCPKLKLT